MNCNTFSRTCFSHPQAVSHNPWTMKRPFLSIRSAHFLMLLLLSLACFPLQAQEYRAGWTPTDYFGIPGRDKQNAFFDEFENNQHGWDLGQSVLQEEIRDGDFFIATLTSAGYTKRRSVPMNHTGNYEAELRVRYVRGEGESQMGLTFGRDARGNEYNFLATPQGRFRVIEVRNGRPFDLIGWQASGALTRYSYNSLMIRKVADRWYFFINEELVGQMPARELFGNDFGISLSGNMAIEVDLLRISEIRTVDNTGPEIVLTSPVVKQGVVEVTDRVQVVQGRVHDVSGVSDLKINGYPIRMATDGTFIASLQITEAVSTVEIVALDRFRNSTVMQFSMKMADNPVVYRPPQPMPPTLKPTYASEVSPLNEFGGKNYIVLIGINQYDYWNTLHNAVRDCNDLAGILTSQYRFEQENVITLFNQQATRENILELFESLQDRVGPNDNLIIYYAGHGYYDTSAGLGFWVPADARLNKVPDFIGNSTIHDYLATINSHHTLLIADACYAGSLFARSRGIINEANRSRWAFTSGDIEKVWDGQPGENSPFARHLIRFLQSNTDPQLRANELIEAVSMVVQRNTSQNPRGDALMNVGDEGGVMILHRK